MEALFSATYSFLQYINISFHGCQFLPNATPVCKSNAKYFHNVIVACTSLDH